MGPGVNGYTNWTHLSYLTARQIFEKLPWKWVLRKHHFTRPSLQLCNERYCGVTKSIDNGWSYLLPEFKKINSIGYNQEKAGRWQTPGSQSNWWKVNLPKSPHSFLKSTLQLTREVKTSRSVNVSKSTVYPTSTKAEQIITFQLLKPLMDSILGQFQRCIDACGEIIKQFSESQNNSLSYASIYLLSFCVYSLKRNWRC